MFDSFDLIRGKGVDESWSFVVDLLLLVLHINCLIDCLNEICRPCLVYG